MGRLRRQYGFWGSLGRMQFRDLMTPEIVSGVLIGAGLAVALAYVDEPAGRQAVTGDYLVISGALLGIVFAAFALVIALMSDSYLRWLEDTQSGVVAFLSPFMVSVGLQVGALLGAVLYRAAASHLPGTGEKWFFGVISVLFFTAALDVVALARSVLLHGIARARGLHIQDLSAARGRNRQAK
jgi:MFS family permease